MKIISFVNQKGGCAKTTSVLNIGIAMAKKGKKVLLIDLDPQANLTTGLGIDKRELKYTMYDLFEKEAFKNKNITVEDVIIEKNGISILPTNISMARADIKLSSVRGREFFVKNILKEVDGFDYCIIDCPPTLGILPDNALVAAHVVYIPVQAEPYAVEGIADLLDTISDINRELNPNLTIGGVFLTMVEKRASVHKIIKEQLENYFKNEIMKTFIRRNIKISEASGVGESVISYDKNSNGAKDYIELCNEILEREGV